MKLIKNRKFFPERRPPVKLDRVEFLSNDKLYKKDKSFGEIICRCEKVSKAEIMTAIKSGATTLDGIKFRTRAGMGRCQGGYCTLRIIKILAAERGIPYESITKSGYDSNIVATRMK